MKRLILHIKLLYYTLLDKFDDGPEIPFSPDSAIHQSRQNVKLMRGVRKLIARLRSMSPESRTKVENLLGKESYKKTRSEIREELQVRRKVMKNPTLKTENDLVNKVVKMAPAYALAQEAKELRKQITACLKAASADPSNPSHAQEAKRLKAKLSFLQREIERMKNA